MTRDESIKNYLNTIERLKSRYRVAKDIEIIYTRDILAEQANELWELHGVHPKEINQEGLDLIDLVDDQIKTQTPEISLRVPGFSKPSKSILPSPVVESNQIISSAPRERGAGFLDSVKGVLSKEVGALPSAEGIKQAAQSGYGTVTGLLNKALGYRPSFRGQTVEQIRDPIRDNFWENFRGSGSEKQAVPSMPSPSPVTQKTSRREEAILTQPPSPVAMQPQVSATQPQAITKGSSVTIQHKPLSFRGMIEEAANNIAVTKNNPVVIAATPKVFVAQPVQTPARPAGFQALGVDPTPFVEIPSATKVPAINEPVIEREPVTPITQEVEMNQPRSQFTVPQYTDPRLKGGSPQGSSYYGLLGGGSGRTGGGSGGQSTVTQPIASPWDELKASAGGGGSGSEPPRGGGGGGEQPPSGGDDPDPEKILRYEDLPKGTRVPDTSKPLYYLQPKPKTMRDTTEGGLNNAKQTAKNIADNPKIGKGVKGVALGAGLTALGVAATQPFIGAEGRQFTRDIIPGEDSPEQQEAYYRQLAKQERELQEAKLRPYLLTPQEQAEMGRQQAYWAAQQRGRFQRVQGMQEVLASQMSNALQAHLQAMSQANNAVQTVMNSEFM